MLLVGLTGGIGSGKSTLARLLAERGAVIVDADVLGRQAIEPGTRGHAQVVERFGTEALAPDGSIDRPALAARVFASEEDRLALEAVVHPEVFRMLLERVEAERDTDHIVVFDAPLIVEAGFHDACDLVVLVTAPAEEKVRRVVEARGMEPAEARERIAAQLPDEEKAKVADVVIENDGGLDDLAAEADRLWERLQGLAADR